jgi:hypothetical protein
MGDSQAPASPCNTLIITRNEMRSAVRVRSSASFYKICRENSGTQGGFGAKAGANLLQPAEEHSWSDGGMMAERIAFDDKSIAARSRQRNKLSCAS